MGWAMAATYPLRRKLPTGYRTDRTAATAPRTLAYVQRKVTLQTARAIQQISVVPYTIPYMRACQLGHVYHMSRLLLLATNLRAFIYKIFLAMGFDYIYGGRMRSAIRLVLLLFIQQNIQALDSLVDPILKHFL